MFANFQIFKIFGNFEISIEILNRQINKMSLPPALLQRLAQRGLVQKQKPSKPKERHGTVLLLIKITNIYIYK